MQELAKAAGKQVMKLYAKKITARQIITKESITNAIKTCMAIGRLRQYHHPRSRCGHRVRH